MNKLDNPRNLNYTGVMEKHMAASPLELTPFQSLRAQEIALSLETALKGTMDTRLAQLSANIAGLVVAAVMDQPSPVIAGLEHAKLQVAGQIANAIKALPAPKVRKAVRSKTAIAGGQGVGELVTTDEGRQNLDAIAVDVPLEDWAGRMAGSTELERDFGINRSTLHGWQQTGHVVSFLKGLKKHVYPTAQFVDGRPVKGLSELVEIAGSPRTAWLWLNQPNAAFKSRPPLDLLRADRHDEVLEAARDYFHGL